MVSLVRTATHRRRIMFCWRVCLRGALLLSLVVISSSASANVTDVGRSAAEDRLAGSSDESATQKDESVNNTDALASDALFKFKIYATTMGTVNSIVAVIICFGNILVIVSYVTYFKLRTKNNFFIVHLALADLVLGLGAFYHVAIHATVETMSNKLFCAIDASLLFFCGMASTSAIVAVTVDRFQAIMWPLTYDKCPTRRDFVTGTLKVWLMPVVIGILLPLLMDHDVNHPDLQACNFAYVLKRQLYAYGCLPYLWLSFVVNVALYIPILITTYRHAKAIASQVVPYPPTPQESINPERLHFKKGAKILKTTFIIFSVFYGCLMPYLTAISLQIYIPRVYVDPTHAMYSVSRFTGLFVVFNSAVNPIIYTFRCQDFREQFSKIILRKPIAMTSD